MTFGAARVVLLDTGEDKPDASEEYSGLVDFDPYIEAETAWLRREIAGEDFRQATWRLVVMHIPPDWRKEEAKLWHGQRRVNQWFAPLFDAGKVTAVLSGHTHVPDVIEPCPDASRGLPVVGVYRRGAVSRQGHRLQSGCGRNDAQDHALCRRWNGGRGANLEEVRPRGGKGGGAGERPTEDAGAAPAVEGLGLA